MPLADDTFDIVINSQSFHHYPNPDKFFKEVYRILKPGGKFILRDMTSSKPVLYLMNTVGMKLANITGHGDVKASSLDEIRTYSHDAGLEIIKLEQQKKFRLHLVAQKPEQ